MTSIKIWFQKHVVAGRLPLLDSAYERHVAEVVRPGTEVRFETLPAETYQTPIPEGFVRYGSVETMFSWYFAAQALRAEQAGFDAYIIGTSQDPGLQDARTLSSIPVLGYGETSFHFAAMMGLRFAVVGFIPELEEPITENIRTGGLSASLACFEYVRGGRDLMMEALAGQSEGFVVEFLEASRRAIARGAEAIIPGEGLPNEILYGHKITEVDGASIIDSNGLVIKMAELSVECRRLGIVGPSSLGYRHRHLRADEMERLFRIFAPRSIPGSS